MGNRSIHELCQDCHRIFFFLLLFQALLQLVHEVFQRDPQRQANVSQLDDIHPPFAGFNLADVSVVGPTSSFESSN